MMAYQWLGLYSSVNLTGKEFNDFYKFPCSIPAPIPISLEFQLLLTISDY